jgi:hypothetical protein
MPKVRTWVGQQTMNVLDWNEIFEFSSQAVDALMSGETGQILRYSNCFKSSAHY